MIEHGIIIEAKDGNRTYVHANVDYLFYKELQGLARKSKGSLEIVRKAIGNKGIDVAFVFGSLATETEQIESDVDLMILGDVGLREIVKRLSGISSQIGREINPHVMKVVEFTKRKINGDHFVVSICEHPKRFLVGSEDDLK